LITITSGETSGGQEAGMPEYVAPGVYVEEDGPGPKPIEGLNTSTAGFVGPTRTGPTEGPPNLITSLSEFERIYGDGQPLRFAESVRMPNFMWQAARAFFDNGGQQLYVARVFRPLQGSSDGARPLADDYAGKTGGARGAGTGLRMLEQIDEVSIVAAPGATYGMEGGYENEAEQIASALIAHAELMLYRFAVLDSGVGQSAAQVGALRQRFNSSYAALYYPWVQVADPITGGKILVPPSGFVAGIYARNDASKGVSKAPANEVVTLAVGLEQLLDENQGTALDQEGINVLRFFTGRGYLVWGARTVSSDPQWKYVNLRRYFAYLEHSIDSGTQWAVFEPNGETLWANVRQSIENFLLNEWKSGALLGQKPEQAYFVRCDQTTMTQNDLDNGRLVVLIGVAPVQPAEFVIFRIGQWTGDHKTQPDQ
jgi:phage tail sheath protein FI